MPWAWICFPFKSPFYNTHNSRYDMRINLILLAVFTSSILSCSQSEETASDTPTTYCIPAEFKPKLRLAHVVRAPVTEGVHLMGSVESNPDNVVEYVSLVKGIVSSVNFSLGDKVEKGQVLAELRSAELSALQSQSASIEAEIQSAKRNFEAVQSMHTDQLASDNDLAEASSRLQSLQSEKKRIAADLSLYGANIGKDVFQLKAPASGIITTKAINPGLQISDERGILFTIASLENVWIMTNVYASNLEAIQAGMPVKISTLSYPGEIFEGRIAVLSPVMDEQEKVLKARIVLDNPGLKLKPGMLVDVTALRDRHQQANAIPPQAMLFSDNEYYVVVYKDDCDLAVRKITLIAQNARYAYVDESSLQPGEKVLIENQLLIFEKLKNMLD